MLTNPRNASDVRHFFCLSCFCKFSFDSTSAANSEMLLLAFALVIDGSFLAELYRASSSRYAACCSFLSNVMSSCAIWMTRSTAACVPSCNNTSCVSPPLRLKSTTRLVAMPNTSCPSGAYNLSCSLTVVLSAKTSNAKDTARFNGWFVSSSEIDLYASCSLLSSNSLTCSLLKSLLSVSEPIANRFSSTSWFATSFSTFSCAALVIATCMAVPLAALASRALRVRSNASWRCA